MADYDVIIIGGGIMGAATTRELARRGRKVLLLERFEPGHKRGSSHGSSRIFRFSYPDRMYVAMAQESLLLWRGLEKESGGPLLTITGGLDRGPRLADHVAALTACGALSELLTVAEVNRRFPLIRLPKNEPVLFQPDAGIVAADRALAALVNGARAAGADIRDNTATLALEVRAEEVRVRLAYATLSAARVVVTAGAWARQLLAGCGIDLPVRPTRETVAYFALDQPLAAPPLVEWRHPSLYALPAPGLGIKAGEHQAGPTIDPNIEGVPNQESTARISAWIASRFPAANPSPVSVETCLYTNTADDSFILERHGPVVVGSPCSGHGFKFAPLIGRRLADLALE